MDGYDISILGPDLLSAVTVLTQLTYLQVYFLRDATRKLIERMPVAKIALGKKWIHSLPAAPA